VGAVGASDRKVSTSVKAGDCCAAVRIAGAQRGGAERVLVSRRRRSKYPPDDGFPEFIPGQYTTVGLFGAAPSCDLAEREAAPADPHKLIKRAYCIASSPVNKEFLEFFIHLVPHGVLSPRLFALKIGDRAWSLTGHSGN
jgi:hypothetical protein